MPEYKVDDYLAGKYGPKSKSVSKDTKSMYKKILSEMKSKFPKTEFKQMAAYSRFSFADSTHLCGLSVRSEYILIYYKPNDKLKKLWTSDSDSRSSN